LLVALASAGAPGVGNVALMSFAIEAPYGLSEVQGRRPDGAIVMTGHGAWFRAGFGQRNPTAEAGQPGQPPACVGYVQRIREVVTVDGHPATIVVGDAKLKADGTPMVVFSAQISGSAVAPFVVEAIVPGANGAAWEAELRRTVGTVDLAEE